MLRDVHPIPGIVRRGRGGGTAHALRAVRQFAWLEAGSGKVALSRPTSAAQYPKAGLTQPPSGMLRDVHPNPGIVRRAAVVGLPPAACANASRWAANRIDAFKAS